MGHVAARERKSGHGLAMTAVYTHTRPEIRREQLLEALAGRPAAEVARRRMAVLAAPAGQTAENAKERGREQAYG
jgi:hypothetical protein